MNPFNLLINYVIANSRASYYNVSGNQEVTNTALLTGMISENTLLSYLIIDNKAKSEGENSNTSTPVVIPAATHSTKELQQSGSGTSQTPVKEEPKKETTVPNEESLSLKTFETFKNDITTSNKKIEELEEKINELAGLREKLESFDKEKKGIIDSIEEIEKRLDEIAKTNQSIVAKPTEPDVKVQSKTNTK
ncbi:hypothetical protein ASF10_13410 [Flavobacterium sp. Leaf82]|uniref:hypothetical protein n=1 Tax=unclassified Flavobacterium TaxID=196869 RepID=UPI0006F37D2B|nr:hypothetical protein [Flavobacterium sp. Leaf82]KQO21121.1 hypothetical protein ASF10_13410 [Flavobacterium sp. Leaf82]